MSLHPSSLPIIALDAMGGDHAPQSIIDGAALAAKNHDNIRFIIVGREDKIRPLISLHPKLAKITDIVHADGVVSSHEKPSVAIRSGKDSSMRVAIDLVKDGKAHAVVSAGNTGALMAMAKIALKSLPGVDRPAIVSLFPTKRGKSVLLDLGANIVCTSDNLYQFAIMGNAFAKAVLNIEKPSVGILNVGEEETKGHEIVRGASQKIKDNLPDLNFYGYVEGTDITLGTTDVIVTDGFTGNIALKTAEGTAKICKDFLKAALLSSWLSKLGALLAAGAFKRLAKTIDPRYYNGAMFVGLSGIAVKSHGNADSIGFANAITVAYELVSFDINQKIIQELTELHNGAPNSGGGQSSLAVEAKEKAVS